MSPQIAWVALVTAGLLDVGWAIAMKYADGYTRLGWSIASLVLLAAFVFLLGTGAAGAGNRRRLHGVDRHRRGRHLDHGRACCSARR